ncbi:hypothetical protein BGZ54_001389 [Gamsiella multidivaricata]|nr:hypothetical protein BGZ54_001389 [Gamsiella multidivaricata]
MREPNFSFPNQNRAAICITSSIYDRRALDCTDYVPIINTLTNLAYLTGSTPTIREFITKDGGLERLVTILKNTKVNDKKNGLKWTLAFQCVVNIGVRGTEHIRKRVVQAGMIPVIVNVLESFFTVLKSVSDENERKRLLWRVEAAQQNSQPMVTDGDAINDSHPYTAPTSDEHDQRPQESRQGTSTNTSSSSYSSTSITAPALTTTSTIATGPVAPLTDTLTTEPTSQNSALYNHTSLDNAQENPSTMPSMREQPQAHAIEGNARSIPMENGEARPQHQFFYREDDILHSLQLLAYLSKYPSLRSSFHTDSGSNVFAIVEKFTHRTMHPLEIQYWAGVIMRNACRKDDTRKGIRQCAYTGCGKWETKPREFAKCRRCRKAKYCSKQCQSKAWNEGHRWWCIEKKPESMGVSSSFGADLPPAPPPPPPPSDLQDQPEAGHSLMENGGISSMASGTTGARMIGGGPIPQVPQRSMTHPHPSTAPIRTSSRTELMPHLGISPDSPTPEQLAQRFVQQVALHPGQHNELAQHLHAQFQQYFPPHHQAEAKRLFSFHAREHFARYQRQQELLRNNGMGSSLYNPTGRAAASGIQSAPLMTTSTTYRLSAGSSVASASRLEPDSDASKQGKPRRRSDLDSDDEDTSTLQSGPHSTTGLSVPMLTQDLSTTMSLESTELSGPLSTSLMEGRTSTDPSVGPSSVALTNESDAMKAEQAAARDFKVRKLMARDESSGPSTENSSQQPSRRQDEWTYSRHMAKDHPMDP